jgi:hypothetical protein
MARDYMRIAAGPLDARFVHALSNQLATDHRATTETAADLAKHIMACGTGVP